MVEQILGFLRPDKDVTSKISSLNIELNGGKRPFLFRAGTSDEGVIRQIFVDQEYDIGRLPRLPGLAGYMQSAADGHEPLLVVDAGANIGASSVYFANLHPAIEVVAIEPEAQNFEFLRQNSMGLKVEALHAALVATPGRVQIVDPGQGHWGFRTESLSAGNDGIRGVTINEIYAERPSAKPFIVKIDIEGGEKDLFASNTEWVETTPLIIIELHDWLMPKGRTSQSFLRCIAQHDRDFVHRGENIFSISNLLN